jgi:ABC-type Mn2+/Zn2+ transport system ATPase subunit
MLTRIYIHNFRTFINFELELMPMQLFMGPNGAGKTALLEVIERLRCFICEGRRVHDVFPLHERSAGLAGASGNMHVELDMRHRDEGVFRYGLEIDCNIDQGLQRVVKEWLHYNEKPLFQAKKGEAQLYRDDHTEGPRFPMDWSLSGVGFLMEGRDNRLLAAFKQRLNRVFFVRIQPHAMEEESRAEAPRPQSNLSNLADWYRYLVQAQPDRVHEAVNDLRERLPGFRSLRFREAGDGKILLADFEAEQGGVVSLRFKTLSDGQKATIALYMLLRALPDSSGAVLCIDEPENYLALPEIQPWLDELTDLSDADDFQVLLISHHPRMVNLLAAEQGMWLERQGDTGPTRMKAIGPERAEAPIKLDELIERGWLFE